MASTSASTLSCTRAHLRPQRLPERIRWTRTQSRLSRLTRVKSLIRYQGLIWPRHTQLNTTLGSKRWAESLQQTWKGSKHTAENVSRCKQKTTTAHRPATEGMLICLIQFTSLHQMEWEAGSLPGLLHLEFFIVFFSSVTYRIVVGTFVSWTSYQHFLDNCLFFYR